MTPLASNELWEYFRDEWPLHRFSALELRDLAERGVTVASSIVRRSKQVWRANEVQPPRYDDQARRTGVREVPQGADPVQVGPPLDRVEQTASAVSERECDPEPSVIAARAAAVRQARQPRKRVA
jgi:hypothetical protein